MLQTLINNKIMKKVGEQQQKSRIKKNKFECMGPGSTEGGSITVPLTSCLTGLESTV
jgi:hypothetical protein